MGKGQVSDMDATVRAAGLSHRIQKGCVHKNTRLTMLWAITLQLNFKNNTDVGQRAPREPQTQQHISNVIGYPLQIDIKKILLKIQNTYGLEHGET